MTPGSVTVTLSGGYQILYNAGGYELQRRKSSNEGTTFGEWETVSLDSASRSTTEVWADGWHYTDGSNEWTESIICTGLTMAMSIAKASPDDHGEYYQYRARTLPNYATPDKDWINYYIGANHQRSHWQFTNRQIEELEAAGREALSPWSGTVQCQRVVKILPPSYIRIEPSKGRKTVTVSWQISDVSSFQARFQNTIDYYIKVKYTDDKGEEQEFVAFKATLPASLTGRASITFTNDAAANNGVLGRLPNCKKPKTLSFTVYACYATITSDSVGWVQFQLTGGGVRYYNNGWQDCTVYYYNNGEWVECSVYYYHNGEWVECGT